MSTTTKPKTAKRSKTPAASPVAAAIPAATPPSGPATSALSILPAPPPSANIPVPPSATDAPGGRNYRGFVPRKTELAALPGAVNDLKRCTTFAQIFGATGLPYAQVVEAFDVANQWSQMRSQTAAWDAYCQTQEGICWGVLRAIMDTLKPAFAVATSGDPSLASSMPSFATLFRAKKLIAQKSASTKRLNKAAVAKGEAPVHGGVGKRRQRAAEKAALTGSTRAASAGPTAPAPTAPTTTSAAPAAPVAVEATAPGAATGGTPHA